MPKYFDHLFVTGAGQSDAAVSGTTAAAGGCGGGLVVTELLDLDRLLAVSTDYWLRPRLSDENVMFADLQTRRT